MKMYCAAAGPTEDKRRQDTKRRDKSRQDGSARSKRSVEGGKR